MATSNKGVILSSRPGENNATTAENFAVKDFDVPECESGQIVAKTLYLSVDPYMRCRMNEDTGAGYLQPFEVGKPPSGGGVGEVIQSRCEGLVEGDVVYSESFVWPWMEIVALKGSSVRKIEDSFLKKNSSLALGILGMPGVTSVLGIQEKSQIVPGRNQTLVVSGAAGACGSAAGQIGRLEGCSRVVGICGSDEKCKYLVEDLNFDGAINYKSSTSISGELRTLCPDGVDAYFDNVGGKVTEEVLQCMNKDSHVILCGQIASYNKDLPYPTPLSEKCAALVKERNITRDRFLVLNYMDKFPASLEKLSHWVAERKLKYRETVTEGIENTGNAFISMMEGGNIGKQIIKA